MLDLMHSALSFIVEWVKIRNQIIEQYYVMFINQMYLDIRILKVSSKNTDTLTTHISFCLLSFCLGTL